MDTWPCLNTLRLRQNGRCFADNNFKRIFLNENVRISIKISLKFVPKGPISNNPALVHIMAWRRSGDKPLYEPMMVSLLTHICVTRPQWVNKQQWCSGLWATRIFPGATQFYVPERKTWKSSNFSTYVAAMPKIDFRVAIGKTPLRIILWCPTTKMLITKTCFLI